MTQLLRDAGPLVLLAFAAALLAAVVVLLRPRRGMLSLACAMYALTLAGLLLRPVSYSTSAGVSLAPFAEISHALTAAASWQVPLVQLLGNVVLFVPFGLLMPTRFKALRSLARTVAAAAASALLIEVLQLALATGRVASVDDVMLNTVGAAVGFAGWRALESAGTGRGTQRLHRADAPTTADT